MPIVTVPRSASNDEDAVILITRSFMFTRARSGSDAAAIATILVDYLPGDTFDRLIDMIDKYQKSFHIGDPAEFFQALLEENE